MSQQHLVPDLVRTVALTRSPARPDDTVPQSGSLRRAGRAAAAATTLGAVAFALNACRNLYRLRELPHQPEHVPEYVSILMPLRNEESRAAACLRTLIDQRGLDRFEIVVLDDASTDDTRGVVRHVAGDDPRVRLLTAARPPRGWLGRASACHQLAVAARGTVYVFVDADVLLGPWAVAATVAALRDGQLGMLTSLPRRLVNDPARRWVRPLPQWVRFAALPALLGDQLTGVIGDSTGQLMAVDAAAYWGAGGHGAAARSPRELAGLASAIERAGGRCALANGNRHATCRYDDGDAGWAQGRARGGDARALHPVATVGGIGLLAAASVIPPLAGLAGLGFDRRLCQLGLLGYGAVVASRIAVARRMGDRGWPDALNHPVATAVYAGMAARSLLAAPPARSSHEDLRMASARTRHSRLVPQPPQPWERAVSPGDTASRPSLGDTARRLLTAVSRVFSERRGAAPRSVG